jgi:GxxExxY protein
LEDKRLPNFLRDKVVKLEWEQQSVNANLPYPELTSCLLQACHRVHVELGPGFLHQVYRRATMIELQQQELSYQYNKQIPVTYQGRHLGMQDVRLIAVGNKVLLATVAVEQIDETMKTKLQTRLKQLGLRFGLLVNFNRTTLEAVTVQTNPN